MCQIRDFQFYRLVLAKPKKEISEKFNGEVVIIDLLYDEQGILRATKRQGE